MRRLTGLLLALGILLAAPAAGAQAVRDSVLLIRTSRLFDSETGEMRTGQDIVVRRDRIEKVGPALPAPPGARVIDLRAFVVMPGLIDAHTHLLYLESPKSDLTSEGVKAVVVEGTPLRALHGAARGRTFLAAGITTVRDLGNAGRFGDVALARAIRDGSIDGPRMFVSGPGLSPFGGQFPGVQPGHQAIVDDEYRIVRGADDAAQAVVENVTLGATVIKIYAENTPNPGSLSEEEMAAIVRTARRLGVRVAAHATGDAGAWRAVTAGVNSIEHGYRIADSTLRLMREKGVALVPTDLDSLSGVRYGELQGASGMMTPEALAAFLGSGRERLRRALQAGVTIVAGSDNYIDMGWPQGESARRVLFAYRDAGMPAAQVLQAATINAARLLGRERDLGAIRAGALADIIAVEGDPLSDFGAISRVRFVLKGGRVYAGPE